MGPWVRKMSANPQNKDLLEIFNKNKPGASSQTVSFHAIYDVQYGLYLCSASIYWILVLLQAVSPHLWQSSSIPLLVARMMISVRMGVTRTSTPA